MNYSYANQNNPSGCWTFETWDVVSEYKIQKLSGREDNDVKVIWLSGSSENWQEIERFKNLEEVHLFAGSQEQCNVISKLKGIKRLSLESCRLRNIDFFAEMNHLEELTLVAVSGFDDIEPLVHLKNLTALKLKMLRRVEDFTPLDSLIKLKFLFLGGNFDFQQPIFDLNFFRTLERLEYIIFDYVKILERDWPALPMANLKSLKYVDIPRNTFTIENFALIAEALKGVEGAKPDPVTKDIHFFHGNEAWLENVPWQTPDEKIDHINMHRPLSPGITTASSAILALEGCTDIGEPSSKEGYLNLLGRGSRGFKSTLKNANKRCLAHIEKYEEARKNARIILQEAGYPCD